MAKFWREEVDPARHRDFMSGYQDSGGLPVDAARLQWVYFVRECGVTLQFVSLDQLREAREYFALSRLPASRRGGIGSEHYWQRWWERLPAGLVRAPKKRKMLAALEGALAHYESRDTGRA